MAAAPRLKAAPVGRAQDSDDCDLSLYEAATTTIIGCMHPTTESRSFFEKKQYRTEPSLVSGDQSAPSGCRRAEPARPTTSSHCPSSSRAGRRALCDDGRKAKRTRACLSEHQLSPAIYQTCSVVRRCQGWRRREGSWPGRRRQGRASIDGCRRRARRPWALRTSARLRSRGFPPFRAPGLGRISDLAFAGGDSPCRCGEPCSRAG